MFDKPEILRLSASLAENAATRLSAIAGNVANADTPGYRARDAADFRETYRAVPDLDLRATRPGHLAGVPQDEVTKVSERPGGHMSPNGNNVSLEAEMMRVATVRQDHDLALTVYKTSLGILRASLGRH